MKIKRRVEQVVCLMIRVAVAHDNIFPRSDMNSASSVCLAMHCSSQPKVLNGLSHYPALTLSTLSLKKATNAYRITKTVLRFQFACYCYNRISVKVLWYYPKRTLQNNTRENNILKFISILFDFTTSSK